MYKTFFVYYKNGIYNIPVNEGIGKVYSIKALEEQYTTKNDCELERKNYDFRNISLTKVKKLQVKQDFFVLSIRYTSHPLWLWKVKSNILPNGSEDKCPAGCEENISRLFVFAVY